jgi:hypothetical protein
MGRAIQYRVIMVNPTGGSPTELVRAQVLNVTWELNAPGEASYTMPMLDPQAADSALLLEREVQIWRNGVLIWWGIPVAYRATLASVTFTAYGLLYYFQRRYFGPVYSNTMIPLLENGTFEAATVNTGWASSVPAPTIAASTLHKYAGTKSIKLTGGGSASTLYYIYQFVTEPTPARSRPVVWTLSAWCYPEVTTYGSEDRGIEIQDFIPVPPNQQWALLNPKVPQNRWSRLETSLEVQANSVGQLTIALFAPAVGSVYYDQVRLTYEQKTGAIEGEDWVDDYLRRVFNYGAGNSGGGSTGPGGTVGSQNSWWGATVLKSPLNMTFFPSLFSSGSVPADTFWSHEDRGNIYQAMLEVPKRDKADFEVTWNAAGTARGLTPYVPRKGSIKKALALELGRNITTFTFDVDGRQSANDVTVIGRNSGNTKEVGQAGGPTPSTLDGRQYELVEAPPQEVDGQGLIDTAVSDERRLRAPVKVPTITAKAAGLLDTTNVGGPLVVGDVVPVRMNYGIIQESDLRRVVKMTLTPATETLALVLNTVV